MSDETLSRNEVEELLRSMDSGETKPKPEPKAAPKPAASTAAADAALEAKADALLAGKKSAPARQRVGPWRSGARCAPICARRRARAFRDRAHPGRVHHGGHLPPLPGELG